MHNNNDELVMNCQFNEPITRVLSYAIEFTLEKWPGDPNNPEVQRILLDLKSQFRGMVLEYDFQKDYKG